MAKLNWEKANSQARFDQFRSVGQTDKVPKQAPKHRKDRERKLLAVHICDCLDGGTVNDVDYPVLLDAADRLSKDTAMTPKQSGVWSKYANAAN